jgi:TolB-like protein/DNA-binding winged helix-turn-helix (wHTH) protein/tetratricopeptide (TPR) repeat protein
LKPANSLPLRIGDWRVDPGVDEITRDGAVVKLEPRAMRLLLCLAERAGQVVSIEELLDEVWADVVVTSDSVYQAVAALRRILGDHAKEPAYIATLPRRGYRLVASVAAWSEPASARPLVPPLTPIVDTPPTATAPTYSSLRWERALFLIGLTLIIGYLIIGKAWRYRQPVAPVSTAAQVSFSDKSIAVLPFVDMSESKDQEYFADGMAEEVIDLLARVPGIRVIGRTSSFQFKGKSDDLRTIGTALGAAYVVEGSVRKSGDRLRVTAQLIGAREGSPLWSETYDKSAGEVLKVQDQIAVGLVRALQVAVGADDLQTSPALKSTEAYDLYLRGREVNQRYDRQGFEAAIGYFQQALEIDPTSERAALELALAQNALAIWGFVPPREGFERARQSAKRALKLNPRSGLAHGILANIHSIYDWDWQSADRESTQAVTFEPRSSMVLGLAGLAHSGFRWDASARLLSASLVLDPLNAAWRETLGNIRYREGRLSEAETELRKVLELSPTYGAAHFYLGQILLAEGKREAALEEMPQEAPESGRDTGLAIIYHAIGRKGDSDAALARLTTDRASDAAYEIAEAHAFRGEIDEAFAWLNRAYQQKDVELFTIKGDPLLKTLEPDTRYKAFMRKMNLSK